MMNTPWMKILNAKADDDLYTPDDRGLGVTEDEEFQDETQPEGQDEVEATEQVETEQEASTKEAPVETKAESPKLTPEQYAEILNKIKTPEQPTQPPAETKKQYTPEELDELFHKPKVTKELLAKLGFNDADEEQIAGFKTFVDGISQHVSRMNELTARMTEQRILRSIEPVASFVQAQQQRQIEQQFYTKHKDLTPHKEIVRAVAASLKVPDNVSVEQAFESVASETKKLLAKSGIALGTNNNSTQRGQGAGANTAMRSLSSPGRSVAESPQTPSSGEPDQDDIYND